MSLPSILLEPGEYILAVSGGVDSVVLLHLLKDLKPIVAHVDHGIRSDSAEDALFVKSLAENYGLQFECRRFELGPEASEAEARRVRYEFLNSICKKYDAQLVTAHHQDDLLETAILNILRGTGPHGLVGMLTNNQILRPFMNTPKAEILKCAKENKLKWREDSTNQNETYLRNYVRMQLMPNIASERAKLVELINQTAAIIKQIDSEIKNLLPIEPKVSRKSLLAVDYKTLTYLMRELLMRAGVQNVSRPLIERVSICTKTLPTGKRLELDKSHDLRSLKDFIEITTK